MWKYWYHANEAGNHNPATDTDRRSFAPPGYEYIVAPNARQLAWANQDPRAPNAMPPMDEVPSSPILNYGKQKLTMWKRYLRPINSGKADSEATKALGAPVRMSSLFPSKLPPSYRTLQDSQEKAERDLLNAEIDRKWAVEQQNARVWFR